MSGMSGMRLKVNTEQLKSISSEVEGYIKDMRRSYNEVENIVNRSNSYWEGEGQTSYLQAYRRKYESVEEALSRFSDNVTNLRTIAGVYETTEADAVDTTDELLSDVIV